MQHGDATESGETVGGSSCRGQLSAGGGSTKMISDGCPDTNGKVLIKGIGKNLLPNCAGFGERARW